ncbi:MAG: cytidylate kinase family protein [Rhabdochlamydiaceae bacterium]
MGRKTSKKKISVMISGMPSVGKTTAAEAISRKFRLKHIAGGDMLKLMAYERGYKPAGSEWWDTKDGMDFLSERRKDPNFDREVDRRLGKYLNGGGVVITSYSMPWLTAHGLKLWFHASQKIRAKRLAGRDHISVKKALSIVRKRDLQNKRLYKKLYGINFGLDLTPFNFIIDTEKMSAKQVANAACKLVSAYCSKDM